MLSKISQTQREKCNEILNEESSETHRSRMWDGATGQKEREMRDISQRLQFQLYKMNSLRDICLV